MVRNRSYILPLTASALLFMGADLAQAQVLAPGQTVGQRSRADFEPLGARLGSFLFFPKLELRQIYNDNIYATDTNEEEDSITVIAPSFELRSDWSVHSLRFTGSVDDGNYWDNSAEDYTDYSIATDGRVDITRDVNVVAGAGYKHLHEDRGSPDNTAAAEPTEYDVVSANLGGFGRFNRLSANLDYNFDYYNYDDQGRGGNLSAVNNDDRDRDSQKLALRVGYEIQQGYDAFVKGSLNWQDYRSGLDDSGFNRDSDGYEVAVGLKFDLTGVAFGEASIGYLEQEYDDARLPNTDGIGYGLAVTWTPTQLLTVRGNISRTVQETTSAGASGYLASAYGVSAEYEILRNFLANAGFTYTNNDYEGINRDDDLYDLKVGAKYMFNRNFYIGPSYNYKERDSNLTGQDYENNIFMLTLGAQL
jgi:hypothetical protein